MSDMSKVWIALSVVFILIFFANTANIFQSQRLAALETYHDNGN